MTKIFADENFLPTKIFTVSKFRQKNLGVHFAVSMLYSRVSSSFKNMLKISHLVKSDEFLVSDEKFYRRKILADENFYRQSFFR